MIISTLIFLVLLSDHSNDEDGDDPMYEHQIEEESGDSDIGSDSKKGML